MASIVLSVLIVIGLVSILIISQTGAESVTGKGYSDLSSEQKQKYWDCFNGKCKMLLKEAQLSKNYAAYRDCSLNCNSLAQSSSVVWCNDTDGGVDYLTKGTVFSNVYTNGKEDECKEYSNGKMYLKEGRCKNNKYSYLQKKCEEINKNYYCDLEMDVCKEKVPLFVCGDGKLQGTEECDDGNSISNDGCSQSCKNECIDSDGNDTTINGYVSYNEEKSYDQCSTGIFGAAGTESVKENICVDGQAGYTFMYCSQNYVCKEGACIEKDGPKVYSGPGTYTLYVGDSIVGGNYEFTLISVTDQGITGKLEVIFGNGKKYINNNFVIPLIITPNTGPFLTKFGINMFLENIFYKATGMNCESFPCKLGEYCVAFAGTSMCFLDKLSVKVSVSNDCLSIYKTCNSIIEKDNIIGLHCNAICDYSTTLPSLDYSFNQNVIVSMPNGYKTALKIAAQNAQNCFTKITELYNLTYPTLIFLSYVNSNDNGCIFGNYFGNVLCEISTAYSEENTGMNPKLVSFKEKVELNNCVGEYNTIGDGQAHEMTHQYAGIVFPMLNLFLSEGIATYSQIMVGSASAGDVVCLEDNYYFTNNPIKTYPYTQLQSKEHGTGACFLKDLKEKYGEEKFKAIFKYASTLNIGCYNLFADIINPVVGEDAFPIFKDKYKLTEDPEKCTSQAIISS